MVRSETKRFLAAAMRWGVPSFVLLVALALPLRASADVLTFDDIFQAPPAWVNMTYGYAGLNWQNLGAYHGPTMNGGYIAGAIDEYAVFNLAGQPTWVMVPDGTINFRGAVFTAVWYDDVEVQITGYLNSQAVFYEVVPVQTGVQNHYTFAGGESVPVDALFIRAFRSNASFTHFAMDNFDFEFVVPEVAECGNGVVETGEECDDGGTEDGDCCSSACTFEGSGSVCGDDGVSCTVDTCDGAGTCLHTGLDSLCDDGDSCTTDTCNFQTGCEMTSIPQCIEPTLDGYTFYKAKISRDTDKFIKFSPVMVNDALDATPADFEIQKVEALGVPAILDDGPILDQNTRLTRFRLKRGKIAPPMGIMWGIQAESQCHAHEFLAIKQDALFLPTSAAGGPTAPDPNSHELDPYRCYKIKDTGDRLPKGVQFLVDDQIQTRLYDLKKAKRLCVAANASTTPETVNQSGDAVSMPDMNARHPDQYMICYQAKQAKKYIEQAPNGCGPRVANDKGTAYTQPKHIKTLNIQTHSNFGTLSFDTVKEDELCLPATKLLVTP